MVFVESIFDGTHGIFYTFDVAVAGEDDESRVGPVCGGIKWRVNAYIDGWHRRGFHGDIVGLAIDNFW